MHTIHLHNLLFFSHHGMHAEETVTGTNFEVSVDIEFIQEEPVRKISQTINYATVYEIIKAHMNKPVALLETLAENISNAIFLHDTRITNINITINKSGAPISNFAGKVGVSYRKKFVL